MGFQARGFGLAQPWLLQAHGGSEPADKGFPYFLPFKGKTSRFKKMS